jgi:hypothetical protein
MLSLPEKLLIAKTNRELLAKTFLSSSSNKKHNNISKESFPQYQNNEEK